MSRLTLKKHREIVDRLLVEQRRAKERVLAYKRDLRDARATLETAQEAQTIIQQVAQQVQQQAHAKIAHVVTTCLESVFPDPYEFRIRFDRKRGRTEAQLLLYRDGLLLEDPLDESSGGVLDVAAFALRLACLVLSKPPRRRLLVLDEPFKHLSRENRPRVRGMLETLSKEMGVQIILVTHDEEFQVGRVIDLGSPERDAPPPQTEY